MYDEELELKEAIKLAKEKMPNFDTVIDLFSMTFAYISKKSASLSGYTPEEMIGKHISDFMDTPASTQKFKDTVLMTMSNKPVTIPIKTKAGKIIKIKMNFITVESNGHPFLITKAAGIEPDSE